jgi:hypothetical protein
MQCTHWLVLQVGRQKKKRRGGSSGVQGIDENNNRPKPGGESGRTVWVWGRKLDGRTAGCRVWMPDSLGRGLPQISAAWASSTLSGEGTRRRRPSKQQQQDHGEGEETARCAA